MDAMIFAAGFGTRLRPLTDLIPKPLLPVANRPLLAHLAEHLARGGAERLVVNAHHLADAVVEAVPRLVPQALAPRVSVERDRILGTGGGLRRAWELLGRSAAPFVVMNGDILFLPDLSAALRHHEHLGAVATLIVRPDPRSAELGPIDIDPGTGRVLSLLGAPPPPTGATRCMFTGVHVLSPRAFADLPEEGCIIRSTYRRWVDRGEVVGAVIDPSPWLDLGTPATYHAANVDLATGTRTLPGVAFDARGIVAPTASVAPTARIAASVVGDGAQIGASIEVVRSLVLPGARVTRPLVDSIAWGDQSLKVAPPR